MACQAGTTAVSAGRSAPAAEWAAEILVYALLVVGMLSRHYLPERSIYVLGLALVLATLLPPFLMSHRREAAVLGRVAAAMCVGLVLAFRSPIRLPLAPSDGMLSELTVCAALSLGLIVAMAVSWRVSRPELPWWVLVPIVGVLAYSAIMWPLLNRALLLDPESGALDPLATLKSVSITLEYGAIAAYMLTVEPLARRRRLALGAALLLVVRLALPQSGGG